MMNMKVWVAACACVASGWLGALAAPALVPEPQKMTAGDGAFVLTDATVVGGEAAARDLFLKEVGGTTRGWRFWKSPVVRFTQDASTNEIPVEGYKLAVTPQGVKARASSAAGLFYAAQTLRQLAEGAGKGSRTIPCVVIEDFPRFGWRGLHLDECRHFFGKAEVEKFLDLMAYHKMNVLHWHLTDDQGWRIAIDAYPELVEYGAVRPASPLLSNRNKTDGKQYGPFFYTKDEIREVLAYAKARHIVVVPEIELPGHARAALAAYPQFSCKGPSLSPRTPWCAWGVSEDVFCAGNDEAIAFLEKVLDEVCGLFDSPIIHTGGDECPKARWKKCPKCQARMKAEGLKSEHELQLWVTRHFADYLAKKGRRLIGWDEIRGDGLPANAIVMSWRGAAGGIAAATAGYDVVMSPNSYCYLDFGQGLTNDPYAYIGGKLPLSQVYAFDPCAKIPADCQKHILGGQGNNWTEYTVTPEQLEWKCWPRACALSECLWTAPTNRSFLAFQKRLAPHRDRLLKMGVNAAPLQ